MSKSPVYSRNIFKGNKYIYSFKYRMTRGYDAKSYGTY